MDKQMNAALNIMRRMPPSKIELNLSGLVNLVPELTDELLQRVDQPLQAAKDPKNGKHYLLSDYNRDADSYRSPWSNEYHPALADGFRPSPKLRVLEEKANAVFDAYRKLYYEGGISSAYLWDQDEAGSFAGCFLIKKEVFEPQRKVSEGCWDSIHIVEVLPQAGAKPGKGTFVYRLTTTVMLSMTTSKGEAGNVNLSGSLTRQAKDKTVKVANEDEHIVNIGSFIEDAEIDLRNQMDTLYIQKTREVINSIRRPIKAEDLPSQAFVADLAGALKGRSKA